ncbi:MAG: tRNA lysidine(34) synthetase TilS [Cyanophyceae cyanobacterium]
MGAKTPRSPWTDFHGRLHGLLRRRPLLLERSAGIVVAVSGGQDSVALGRLLADLRPHWHWRLTIAHCDHGWRADSAANGAAVVALAEGWGLPVVVRRAGAIARTEAAARAWRYGELLAIAQETGSAIVVTGHTASDRAETLLFNLVRGSGGDGLGALGWRRSLGPGVDLVRPLLEFVRADTAACCAQLGLPIWEDSTNQDRRYRRNRLRIEVLPLLRSHFNPQVDRALARTADLLREDGDCLEAIAAQLLSQCRVEGLLAFPAIARQPLAEAHPALQRRALRQWLIERLDGKMPNRDRVEALRFLLTAPNRHQSDPFPGGAIVRVDGPHLLWIAPAPRP